MLSEYSSTFGKRKRGYAVKGSGSLRTIAPNTSLFQVHQTIQATISIGDEKYLATVDTGATRSLVNGDVIYNNHLLRHGTFKPFNKSVKLADGSTQLINSTYETIVMFDGRKEVISFLVMPDLMDQWILGMDFLEKMRATLKCQNSIVTLEVTPDR